VPLVAEGQVIGVLHVGTLTERAFTHEEQELLQLVADRVALATRAQLWQQERAAATALQRSLLPALLPQLPDFEFASRYVPGDGGRVGGDWYDVFELPSARLCVVVGDVVGRGLSAAVTMGRLRSVLRAYALQSDDPADVLGRVDRSLHQFEPDVMATALCAMLDPPYDTAVLSSAGHLPPVLARPGRDGLLVDVPADLPLGIDPARPRRTVSTPVRPGHGLLLYTDGLIERRGESLDVGLGRLCRAVRPGSAESACATIMSELIGSAVATDDIAVLMVSHLDDEQTSPLDLVLPAVPESLVRIRAAVRRWCAAAGVRAEDVTDLVVAVEEAASNAVEHAYGPVDGVVSVHAALDGSAVVATVRDHGEWREPRGTNRGRGTMLMRGLVDRMVTEPAEPGTRVRLWKNVDGATA
jgi:serine phosphatase RsbU (regulator of sigma subunit)/anti-sigma regulatory factor (Ser/Thr protein kinase)